MSIGQRFRDMGDTCMALAAEAAHPGRKSALVAEAAAYYALADRFDAIGADR